MVVPWYILGYYFCMAKCKNELLVKCYEFSPIANVPLSENILFNINIVVTGVTNVHLIEFDKN